MLLEARLQGELLYSLRAIMQHMTWGVCQNIVVPATPRLMFVNVDSNGGVYTEKPFESPKHNQVGVTA